jgi:DNA repair protein RecO (recombination protein O)
MRVQLDPAYVLHCRPYRETSLILEALSYAHGRVGLVARGARAHRSPWRGLLQPFRPLLLSWSGRHELMTLTGAEAAGGPSLQGRALLAGLYLNELLVRLVPRGDPLPGLYEEYRLALETLHQGERDQPALRRFERRLLEILGYGMVLGERDDRGEPIDPARVYRYRVESGPVLGEGGEGVPVRGATLLELTHGPLADPAAAREARQLMRYVLQHYLGDRPLGSRALFQRPGAPSGAEPGVRRADEGGGDLGHG